MKTWDNEAVNVGLIKSIETRLRRHICLNQTQIVENYSHDNTQIEIAMDTLESLGRAIRFFNRDGDLAWRWNHDSLLEFLPGARS